jgi:hypothetical protein
MSPSYSMVLILHWQFNSLVGPKIFFNIFLSDIISFCTLLSLTTHISPTYVTMGLINVQYNFNLELLDSNFL